MEVLYSFSPFISRREKNEILKKLENLQKSNSLFVENKFVRAMSSCVAKKKCNFSFIIYEGLKYYLF